jgi:hypothetical protein
VLEHFDIIIKLIVSGTAVFGFIKWWIERKSKDKLMAYYEQEIKDLKSENKELRLTILEKIGKSRGNKK